MGISDQSELGLRVGLPIYGSGIDYSRLLYKNKTPYFDAMYLDAHESGRVTFKFKYFLGTTTRRTSGTTTA